MDAQHVICAGQVRHATRQTDATCHKSAEFRYMAGATLLRMIECMVSRSYTVGTCLSSAWELGSTGYTSYT